MKPVIFFLLMLPRPKTGCFNFNLSQANIRILLYDNLDLLDFIRMFDSSVLGDLPKCASNGFIFVTSWEQVYL